MNVEATISSPITSLVTEGENITFFNNVNSAINYIANQKFVDRKIAVNPMNVQGASYFSRFFYYTGWESLGFGHEYTNVILKKGQKNSVGDTVAQEYIDICRRCIICTLNLLTLGWSKKHDRGELILSGEFKNIRKLGAIEALERIGLNCNTWKRWNAGKIRIDSSKFHNSSYCPNNSFIIIKGNPEDIDHFMSCLKREAIHSSYPAHLLMCAKNDTDWSHNVPKEVIEKIVKLFVDDFLSILGEWKF